MRYDLIFSAVIKVNEFLKSFYHHSYAAKLVKTVHQDRAQLVTSIALCFFIISAFLKSSQHIIFFFRKRPAKKSNLYTYGKVAKEILQICSKQRRLQQADKNPEKNSSLHNGNCLFSNLQAVICHPKIDQSEGEA